MKRANYIGAPEFFNLNHSCQIVADAFGDVPFLVGSSLEKRDYRDVDIRLILDDEKFDKMFSPVSTRMDMNPYWSLLCMSISLWLSARSGLPIDFQIQRMTDANEEFKGGRHAIGVMHQWSQK